MVNCPGAPAGTKRTAACRENRTFVANHAGSSGVGGWME
jgi:hypothetical protein